MKNLLFIVFFSWIAISTASAQLKAIGFNKSQITEQFETINEGTTNDGVLYWIGEPEEKSLTFLMYFNEDDICTFAFIVPDTQEDLNGLVEWCNKKYTIISDTEWKSYSNVAIASMSLQSVNNQLIFICKMIKKF